MKIAIISIFPDLCRSIAAYGMLRQACDKNKLEFLFINLRDFSKTGQVDDRPYGGGPGMVMMFEPIALAISQAKQDLGANAKVIYMSPHALPLKQAKIQAISDAAEPLIILAGRYEGIDQRILDQLIDEQWSIGDYILSGGELAAMILADAIARLLPGVTNNPESISEESFSCFDAKGRQLLDHPHYTRPADINGNKVPEVLLSGNHQEIAKWRAKQKLLNTQKYRPDLLDE